jgi:hypothetical protein
MWLTLVLWSDVRHHRHACATGLPLDDVIGGNLLAAEGTLAAGRAGVDGTGQALVAEPAFKSKSRSSRY